MRARAWGVVPHSWERWPAGGAISWDVWWNAASFRFLFVFLFDFNWRPFKTGRIYVWMHRGCFSHRCCTMQTLNQIVKSMQPINGQSFHLQLDGRRRIRNAPLWSVLGARKHVGGTCRLSGKLRRLNRSPMAAMRGGGALGCFWDGTRKWVKVEMSPL